MELDDATCEKARLSRDARFDGRFFIGVTTTGIYCRPVCPVKPPRRENTVFYPTAAAAAEAGFRPCLRCRPETAPGTPAWSGTNATVTRAMRLISDGALDQGSVEALASRLGVGTRHLSRLFTRHLGASPAAVARTRRLHNARTLLDETDLPISELALASGYSSIRRFNEHFLRSYGRSPSAVRKRLQRGQNPGSRRLGAEIADREEGYHIRLQYRPPYDWEGLLKFLSFRATPGVEVADGDSYARSFVMDGTQGHFSVRPVAAHNRLLCSVHVNDSRCLVSVINRVKRMFDLAADPAEINRVLLLDPALAPLVEDNPGMRIPGCWDGFEITVRAIVGQQVSVAAATTTTGRLAMKFGEKRDFGNGLELLFPSPEALCELEPEVAGMPRAKARAIRDLARQVRDGDIVFSALNDPDEMRGQLRAIKGIGEWTAAYVAMRYLGDPHAFPHPDLVLKSVAARLFEGDKTAEPHDLLARARKWQPWSAYGALHLWRHAAVGTNLRK